MKRYLAVLAFALLLPGCSILTAANTPVSTVDAQKAIIALQLGHAAALTTELVYLNQPPCGLAGSPAAPLCASLKVGKQMKAADVAFTATMATAQGALADLGDNPTVVNAAITAAQAALASFQAITATYAGK